MMKSILIFSVLIAMSLAYKDVDFTVEIPAMKRECFFEETKAGRAMDIEYQVIEGGDLDVNFMVQAPDGRVITSEIRKTDGMHTVDPTVQGDYTICFDNSFSRLTSKTVFFEIIVDSAGEDEDDDEEWKNAVAADELYGDKLQSLEVASETMGVIKGNLGKTAQLQGMLRTYEAKDRSIAERNYERVNFWSTFNIVVMAIVFVLQVYSVRHMFSDEKKTRT